MLAAIADIRSDTRDLDSYAFQNNPMAVRAVLFSIEVIGEAAKGLDPARTETEPAIPWRAIAGMRNFIAHEYFRIDARRVWDVVVYELDPLEAALLRMRQR